MMWSHEAEAVPVNQTRHKLKVDEEVKKQGALKIQKAFKRYIFIKGLNWRKSIKQKLMAIVNAWRTRRTLNCLGSEV